MFVVPKALTDDKSALVSENDFSQNMEYAFFFRSKDALNQGWIKTWVKYIITHICPNRHVRISVLNILCCQSM